MTPKASRLCATRYRTWTSHSPAHLGAATSFSLKGADHVPRNTYTRRRSSPPLPDRSAKTALVRCAADVAHGSPADDRARTALSCSAPVSHARVSGGAQAMSPACKARAGDPGNPVLAKNWSRLRSTSLSTLGVLKAAFRYSRRQSAGSLPPRESFRSTESAVTTTFTLGLYPLLPGPTQRRAGDGKERDYRWSPEARRDAFS